MFFLFLVIHSLVFVFLFFFRLDEQSEVFCIDEIAVIAAMVGVRLQPARAALEAQ